MVKRSCISAYLPGCCLADCIVAFADGGLEAPRELDLNTYALGANLLVSSSYCEGIDDFVIVFPAPMKFGNAIMSEVG